jgi:hypothetical protein
MRYGIDYDDESDDEMEVEYSVSFTPTEPTRARALATLRKDVHDNSAGTINPFDRRVLAYATGDYFATQYQAPRVVGQAQPQPDTSKPEPTTTESVESYFEHIKVHYPYLYPFVQEQNEPEPTKSPRRRKFEGVNEPVTRKKRRIIESMTISYATATKNEPNVSNIKVPRVVDMVEPPPNKCTPVVEAPRVIVSRPRGVEDIIIVKKDSLHDLHNLLKQIWSIRNNNAIVIYEETEQEYEFHGKDPVSLYNDTRIKTNIYHRFRRWTARTKMKQIASQ